MAKPRENCPRAPGPRCLRRRARRLGLATGAGLIVLLLCGQGQGDAGATATGPVVMVGRLEGAVGPIMADYLDAALARATRDSCELFVLELDTPGGLDTAMRQMVRAILASDIPVAVWVCPRGARAASAGVFLLAAAHVAAMAPATNVGAAHPVSLGQKMDEAMSAKVTNDAVAYLQSLARERGRNVEWSEAVVRESVSVPAEEALKLGVIDLMAIDLPALMAGCDGRLVTAGGRTRALRTLGAAVVHNPMNWRERFLQRITDPTIAYLFLLLGFYGLFFELSNPGSILPGVVGGISLLLAFLAFQSLPVNYVGVLMLVLGLLLLLLEIKVTSHGLLALGGGIAVLFGSLLLYEPGHPLGSLPMRVILPSVIVTVLFFMLLIGLGLSAQRRRPRTGLDVLVGSTGEVLRADGPVPGGQGGRVIVQGEIWECRAELPLRRGDRVRVQGRDGGILLVERIGTDQG